MVRMNTTTPTPASQHPDGSIDCEVRGPLLLIGINRPAKRNGFTPKMFRELGDAYTRLDDDPALRVGVLHAFGDHFTAGLDLPTIAPLMQLTMVFSRWQHAKSAMHGLDELLKKPIDRPADAELSHCPTLSGHFNVRNLQYTYDKENAPNVLGIGRI